MKNAYHVLLITKRPIDDRSWLYNYIQVGRKNRIEIKFKNRIVFY